MSDDFQAADKFSNSRALTAPFVGCLILALQQGVVFAWDWGSNSIIQAAPMADIRRSHAGAASYGWRLVFIQNGSSIGE